MRYANIFIHSLLLVTVPSVALQSQQISSVKVQNPIPAILTYDDVLNLLDDLENGTLENSYSEYDLDRLNQFLIHLANEGNTGEDELILQYDVAELLQSDTTSFQYAYSVNDYVYLLNEQGEVITCNWIKKKWHQTKKFVRKHKKAIIIGAAVLAAAAIIICTAGGAAAGVAGAAGAAAGAAADHDNDNSKISEPEAPQETPEQVAIQQIIQENIQELKEAITIAAIPPISERSFIDTTRTVVSDCTHQIFDGITELYSFFPELAHDVMQSGNQIMPDPFKLMGTEHVHDPKITFESFVESGHKQIDQMFSTDQAYRYTPESKSRSRELYHIGMIPPPGQWTKLLYRPGMTQTIQNSLKTVALAEEVGLAEREILDLKTAGTLEKTVNNTYQAIIKDKAMAESLTRFNKAQEYLNSFKGQILSEIQIRNLLEISGIKMPGTPKGIPDHFKARLANKPGIILFDPKNTHESVRIMPGKPHSPYPHQQNPYVVHKRDGKAVDKFGNAVNSDSPEAHIPIEEFIYRGKDGYR